MHGIRWEFELGVHLKLELQEKMAGIEDKKQG
jgi:hypothetical protein